jgi:hypothetical protein
MSYHRLVGGQRIDMGDPREFRYLLIQFEGELHVKRLRKVDDTRNDDYDIL